MEWCYKCYEEHKKPKGIIRKIIYKIWLACGVSPSKICCRKELIKAFREGLEEGLNNNEKIN